MNDRGFVRVYAALARETGPYAQTPDSLALVRQRVLQRHGWTEEAFEAYGDRYKEQPEQWLEIWQAIQKEMDKNAARDKKPLPEKKKRTDR